MTKTSIKILILEDNKERIKFFQGTHGLPFIKDEDKMFFAETADEAIKLLNEHHFELIFLDHDLGEQENVDTTEHNTGSTVADYIISSNHPKFTTIIIHSLNEPAAISMENKLVAAEYITHRINFLKLKNTQA